MPAPSAASDAVKVNAADGRSADGELAGWDPATGLAAIKVEGLGLTPFVRATGPPAPGTSRSRSARSWSNAVTASTGIVAVVGGPLRTGHGRQIDQIIRVTAPMHGGFAGGAVLDAAGQLMGIGTAAEIRGLAVVIPAEIAWKSVAHVLEHGRPKTGFLGIAGQAVRLPERQRDGSGRDRALLVVDVNPGGPAESGGVIVGDVILDVDSSRCARPTTCSRSSTTERVGRDVALRVLRGGTAYRLTVTIGERPAS